MGVPSANQSLYTSAIMHVGLLNVLWSSCSTQRNATEHASTQIERAAWTRALTMRVSCMVAGTTPLRKATDLGILFKSCVHRQAWVFAGTWLTSRARSIPNVNPDVRWHILIVETAYALEVRNWVRQAPRIRIARATSSTKELIASLGRECVILPVHSSRNGRIRSSVNFYAAHDERKHSSADHRPGNSSAMIGAQPQLIGTEPRLPMSQFPPRKE
eukprot:SAG31_NODE_1208_length_9381_cov_49.003232_8_plen_216_part_00